MRERRELTPNDYGRGIRPSFAHAYRGLLHALAQRNMKIHVVSAILVGLVGSTIPLGLAEKVSLIFCVLLIFFAEILNTAIEALVDLHTEDFRQLAMVTKDTAAASVLVLAIGTIVIFAAIVVYNWSTIAESGPAIVRQALVGGPLTLAAIALLGGWRRRAWVDDALCVIGLGCCAALLPATVSWVFTAMTGMLFVLCWRVAKHRPR